MVLLLLTGMIKTMAKLAIIKMQEN